MIETLYGELPEISHISRTQVYEATHDGEGNRLPLYERSFISFTYDGKSIEDFNFISVINADRATGDLYGKFEDHTSSLEVADGQIFWGTHFTNNELTLKLATDGITDRELNEFKKLFSPGPAKELILAEHPNRGIMARISTPPKYSLLPFEHSYTTTRTVLGQSVQIFTKTTLYKGEIDLTFVMDDPFWYSIHNVLPQPLKDLSKDSISTSQNILDQLKVVLEDNVPTIDMMDNIISGNDGLKSKKKLFISTVPAGEDGEVAVLGSFLPTSLSIQIGGENGTAKLYYAGTAPAPTVLSFTLTPVLDTESNNAGYIKNPYNEIYNKIEQVEGRANYNKLVVGTREFKFSTPGIYTGYNQALSIISDDTLVKNGTSIIDLGILFHDKIKEQYSRAWALACVNYLLKTSTAVNQETSCISSISTFKEAFFNLMAYFLEDITITAGEPSTITASLTPAHFQFNSKLGTATGSFKIRYINSSQTFTDNMSETDFLNASSLKDITENVGDMVYDKYLYLEDRNSIDIEQWKINDYTTVSTDYPEELENFNIEYKHMYL